MYKGKHFRAKWLDPIRYVWDLNNENQSNTIPVTKADWHNSNVCTEAWNSL